MKLRGFTVIELAIVIAVMGILLVLGVVNLSGSQANARDTERKSDIESIAMHLETFYNSGTDNNASIGRYPSAAEMSDNIANIKKTLRDISENSLKAPGQAEIINNATSNSKPTADINKYVYQPLTSSGGLCMTDTEECRSFNLYYTLESTPDSVMTVKSKNQ